MSCWEILGIDETWQEDIIRKAYLKKLPQFHPEENPEGFRILREAMEEAIKEAANKKIQKEAEEEGIKKAPIMDSREIQSFLKEAEELYRDFGRRIEPGEWKKLLSCNVCQDLETQKEAGWALVGFLMSHFHIPHNCYEVMDQAFGWTDLEEELTEHFPENFIEYLLERIEEEDSFRYNKIPLKEDFDYDKFCEAYFELRTALREKDRQQAEKLLAQIEEMDIEHPDMTVLKIRHISMIRGMEEETWELAKQLYKTDKENNSVRYWYVWSAMESKEAKREPEELEKIITSLLEEEPQNSGYWQLAGSFLKSQNRFAQALQAFEKSREYSQEQWQWEYLDEQIADVAGELSKQMEEEGCEDNWAMVHICWKAHRYDKMRELLEKIEPSEDQKATWVFLMAESCHNLEDYKEALKYRIAIWENFEEEKPLKLYMDLAEEYYLTEDRKKALELYCQAAEKFTEEPEIFYRQAKILEEEEHHIEAVAMCDKALKIGFHREAFNLRMEILLDIEEYEMVRDSAKQIMEQGYRSAQVRFDYARALRGLEEYNQAEEVLKELYEQTQGSDLVCEELASLCNDKDQPEEALKWIDEALNKRVTSRRLYMRADYLHDLDRYEEEIELYQKLLDQEDDNYSYYTYHRLGRAFEKLDYFEKAIMNFQSAIQRQPDYGASWDGLGDIFQKQRNWTEAEKAYEKGAKLGHLQATRDLCRLLKRTHQDDKAIECIQEALKKWPEDTSILMIYSDVLVRKKEYEAAVRCLNRYMEVKPSQTARAYREIAQTYVRAKDLDKAQEYYQKAIDQEPASARNWRIMGRFLADDRKDEEKALPYLEKSVELMPDSTYGFMKLGEVYEALGRKEEAIKCYEKSLENYKIDIEEDPKDCCNYEGMADVLVHLGRLDEAQEMAHKAISLESHVFTCNCPFCYEGYEDLSKAEEKKGDFKKALEYMELAGRYATTEYYPEQIERLRKIVEGTSEDSTGKF